MKKTLALSLLALCIYPALLAQVTFKTEYFGQSHYKVAEGETSQRIGDSKGSAMVFQGGVNIPISKKTDINNRPTVWSVSVGGAYARLKNKNFTEPLVIDELLNMGVSLNHLRPLNDKWSLMANVGGGVFMPGTDLSRISLKNVLGSAGVIFIRHLRPNLDLGGGLALNNSFGVPMVFPAVYLNWRTEGKYDVKIAVIKGLEVAAGYEFSERLRLDLVAEMNGQTALLEQNGQDKMFSHVYLVTGLRPEFKIGKKISIPITVGLSAWRPASINDRKLKSIFRDKEYSFQASGYASVGIKMAF
ncbi:DUF6268 family outer membrane beta-barrel protein [Chitinophaga horti]|uniref:DUF6268 family outer membrane beta-barrel protein n=1 Tax=Chitinophaga horti TaxID=2920382 RepID=A0ABY6IVN4_9BACT|nr:DUF6268 family outer membrane beta-barrel protein [Chitinophaga horti]UYQ91431.1 DUF6268 family outer membrane beta-barrel protein [Chitinophaga horti]